MSHQSEIFNHVIIDGNCLAINQAQISFFHPVLFSSFGVYESIKVERGHPFYLTDHLHRLLQSARMIDLDLGVGVATLTDWFYRLLAIDPQATWRLRILGLGAESGDESLIAMQPSILPTYPDRFYREGAGAILYAGQRALPACKSLNTLVNHLARRAANRIGALEGLLYHAGCLTEGARSNLFAVQQGELITPPASEVLSGITRDIILQVMQGSDYPVQEKCIWTDLSLYEELFISSTSMHVMPITRVDGQPIGAGEVGPVTRLVMNRFEAHYQQVRAS